MSRNLCRTDCRRCESLVAITGALYRLPNDHFSCPGMIVADAECGTCAAKYTAWVGPARGAGRSARNFDVDTSHALGFYDLSYRASFNDEPGPGDLPPVAILLTTKEWEAIALLRSAGELALEKGLFALPRRAQKAIDTAHALLDRAQDGLVVDEARPIHPPFVIEGEWVDPNPDPVTGSRSHPFAPLSAYVMIHRGTLVIFPGQPTPAVTAIAIQTIERKMGGMPE